MERRKPMKRTAMKRPTIEQVRAWQSKARKPIAKVGRKAKRERPALDHFRTVLRERHHGWCEAVYVTDRWRGICAAAAVHHAGCDPHHVWPEDRDCGIHDPARGLWLCRTAHDFTEDHPTEAKAAGLLRPHGSAVAL